MFAKNLSRAQETFNGTKETALVSAQSLSRALEALSWTQLRALVCAQSSAILLRYS